MAHEITSTDGLVLHKEEAWHGLGTIVEDAPTPQEALQIAGLDWTVKQTEGVGDGNVHFHLRAPEGAMGGEWEDADGKAISAAVHDLVTEWAGSISAEHGIGQMKRDELGRLADPATLSILRGVKQALDPQGIMNPGKLVPLASRAPAA